MIPITESQAAKMVCPFTRSANSHGTGAPCIATRCMLWQPAPVKSVSPVPLSMGTCGAAR